METDSQLGHPLVQKERKSEGREPLAGFYWILPRRTRPYSNSPFDLTVDGNSGRFLEAGSFLLGLLGSSFYPRSVQHPYGFSRLFFTHHELTNELAYWAHPRRFTE